MSDTSSWARLRARLHEQMPTRRDRVRRLGLRASILALLVLAVLVPSCRMRGGTEQLTVLVDISASIALSPLGTALAALEERGVQGLIAFADHPEPAEDVAALRALELLDRDSAGRRVAGAATTAIQQSETDLEAALAAGIEKLPDDGSGRILVISDGHETRGSARQAAEVARSKSVRIDTVVAEPDAQPARIISLDFPAGSRPDQATHAIVRIATPGPETLDVELRIGAEEPLVHTVEHPGGAATFELPVTFPDGGDVPVAARLLPRDDPNSSVSTALPSRWRATVRVGASPRVLFVEGESRSPLLGALERRGLALDRSSPGRLPTSVADFGEYDLVVLHDIDANDLGTVRMNTLAEWVRSGGALVFASGESSYGEGGYNDTALVDILPVTFEVREEKADVALMISLDKSYSMKGEKMDLAKEASKAALGELENEHRFGLVAFDWNTFNIVPLQSAANRDEIREQISKIEASAQTNFYPALESCFKQLSAIEDPTGKTVKHVILVSDGKTYPDDYEGLVRRMYDADITVSTVAVGLEADVELLQQIAEWGHGRSYFVQDAARVQKILLDEARSKLEDTLVEESTEIQVASSHPVLDGIDFTGAPELAGYVALRARPSAEVLLSTMDDQPILARRRVGLGSTWVFASDLSDRWSAPWLGWSGFAPLVSQVLHAAAAGPFTASESFVVERRGDRIEARADLFTPPTLEEAGGRPRNGSDVWVQTAGAAGDRRFRLDQTAPGTYVGSADLSADPTGDARFELVVDGVTTALATLYHPGTDEIVPGPPNVDLLAELANTTGGTAWQTGELDEALQPRPREVSRVVPLWRFFLALALLLYLVELALHRLGRLDAWG